MYLLLVSHSEENMLLFKLLAFPLIFLLLLPFSPSTLAYHLYFFLLIVFSTIIMLEFFFCFNTFLESLMVFLVMERNNPGLNQLPRIDSEYYWLVFF